MTSHRNPPHRARRRSLGGLMLALLGAAQLASAARKPSAAPVENLVQGDAFGPYAAALDGDGRVHLAAVVRAADGSVRLIYRAERFRRTWTELERVLTGQPTDLALAVADGSPTLAFLIDGAAYVARRDDGGWYSQQVAGPASGATRVFLLPRGDGLEVVLLLDSGAGPARLRRVPLEAEGPAAPSELTLPGERSGRLLAAAFAPEDGNVLHAALVRAMPASQIKVLAADTQAPPLAALSYSRLARTAGPPTHLASASGLSLPILARGADGPLILWAEHASPNYRVQQRQMMLGRFGGGEPLFDADHPLHSLGAAARGPLSIVAVVAGAPRTFLRLRWHDGTQWGAWLAPPGMERATDWEPLEVQALLDPNGRAHLLLRERPAARPDDWRRLVDWEVPSPAQMIFQP